MKLYFEKKNIVYTPNIDWKIHMGSQVFAFILWKRLHTGNAHLSRLESQAILILMGCLFLKSDFQKIIFKFSCVCLLLEKLVNEKHFPVNEKHFLEVVKNLEMSYYLLIISNLVLKLLIAIYILFWIFVFQFHLLEFNFYIKFGSHFYNYYLLFPYYFLIEIFYLSNLVIILLIVTYFIWNNLWNGNYYYFNLFIFQIFYFLDLISIILIIIYFIWDNLWNYIFFQFHSHSTF